MSSDGHLVRCPNQHSGHLRKLKRERPDYAAKVSLLLGEWRSLSWYGSIWIPTTLGCYQTERGLEYLWHRHHDGLRKKNLPIRARL